MQEVNKGDSLRQGAFIAELFGVAISTQQQKAKLRSLWPSPCFCNTALKIAAGRKKDLDDCAILLPKTRIRTCERAQQLLDRYILPDGQQKNAENIENALHRLFGREG